MNENDHIKEAKSELWQTFAVFLTLILFVLMISAFIGLYIKIY